MRAKRSTALAAVLALAGTLGVAAGARGEPVTDDEVEDARAAVTSTAAAVAAIELELAATAAAVEDAWQAVAVAAEDYTQALVAREEADAAADEAQESSAAAAELLEEAHADLGRVALAAYRSGGSLDDVAVLISADGMADYVARSNAIKRLGAGADRAVQRFEAAELVADNLAARADEALETAADATATAEAALDTAEDLQAVAEAEATRTAAERETLIAQLAELRQTSVEVERARQATIDDDRSERAAAAAAESSTSATPTSTPTTTPTTTPTSSGDQTATPSADPDEPGTGSQRGSAAQGEAAVEWALEQVGKSYAYGAAGPDSFDCSGLTMRAWSAAGVAINRTSRDQYRQAYKISYDSMRPGDLIFWGTDPADPGSVYHVAMYVGGGQMVEAPSPGYSVRVTSVRWANTMPYAGRP